MGNDLISRSALLEAFDHLQPPGFEKSISGMVALRMIKGAPAVDAEPVRHGCWLEINPLFKGIYQCSVCSAYATMTNGALADGRKDYYCSNCGAKMDGDECD